MLFSILMALHMQSWLQFGARHLHNSLSLIPQYNDTKYFSLAFDRGVLSLSLFHVVLYNHAILRPMITKELSETGNSTDTLTANKNGECMQLNNIRPLLGKAGIHFGP